MTRHNQSFEPVDMMRDSGDRHAPRQRLPEWFERSIQFRTAQLAIDLCIFWQVAGRAEEEDERLDGQRIVVDFDARLQRVSCPSRKPVQDRQYRDEESCRGQIHDPTRKVMTRPLADLIDERVQHHQQRDREQPSRKMRAAEVLQDLQSTIAEDTSQLKSRHPQFSLVVLP